MEANSDLQPSQPVLPHSRLGIAAALVGLLSMCILVGYLGFLCAVLNTLSIFDFTLYRQVPSILFYVFGFTTLLNLALLILSIITFFQKRRQKLFAVVALVEWLIVIVLSVISFFTIFIFTS